MACNWLLGASSCQLHRVLRCILPVLAGVAAGLAVLHDLLSIATLPLVGMDTLLRIIFHLHLRCLSTTWHMMRGRYKSQRRRAMTASQATGQPATVPPADGKPAGAAAADSTVVRRRAQSTAKPVDEQAIHESLWGMPKQVSHADVKPATTCNVTGVTSCHNSLQNSTDSHAPHVD